MKTNKKHLFLGFFLSLALVTLLAAFQTNQPTQTKTKASGSTTLTLVPASSSKQIGDTIDLDMMVDPGNNLISLIVFQVAFDNSKVSLVTSDPFALNTGSFPTKLDGPNVNTESIGETVSIGADPTRLIQKPTKVGTLHFKAIGPTNGTPSTISFTNQTQAMSAGSNDNFGESVLSSTTPATITIGDSSQITPSVIPSINPSTTPSISPSVNPSIYPTVTTGPTGTSGSTATFTVLLHGVGASGDNPNPSGSSLSNKSPLHPQRNLFVLLYNKDNALVSSISGAINYEASSGTFKGSIDLPQNLKDGSYGIKLKTDRYLRKLIPGAQSLKSGKDNRIQQVSLVAGDTNADNQVDILDYNAFLDCGYGLLNPLPIDDSNSVFNKKACQIHTPSTNIDINDNGIVDSVDYNLFLRELSVQDGD